MTNPDQIREEIEATRRDLSDNVNSLADTVNPAHVAKRQADKVKGAVSGAKDKVLGTASGAKDKVMGGASDAGSSIGSATSNVSDAVTGAPQAVQDRTANNPLALGLIAAGIGWIVGSLIPVSEREQQAAVKVKESATPLVSDAAKEVAGNLKEPAQEAVESVKATAADAAATVKEEGAANVQDVKAQAQDAKDTMQETRS